MMVIPIKVLVFAAHQDDETIGCGGTISKWSSMGSSIEVCFVTNGSTGILQNTQPENIITLRDEEVGRAVEILGIDKVHNLNIPCQQVVNNQENFHKIIKKIREIKPSLVITHNPVCKHRDHKQISELVQEASWKANENILEELGKTHRVSDLWSFEILDPHPNPDYVVDITEHYEQKCRAMEEYYSQLDFLNDIMGYIDGLSRVRGYSINAERGEAITRIGRVPES